MSVPNVLNKDRPGEPLPSKRADVAFSGKSENAVAFIDFSVGSTGSEVLDEPYVMFGYSSVG